MEPARDNDQELIGRLQGGDDTAFDTVLERYRTPVLNFVYRVLGDAAEAEDVAQEVFVRVYHRRNTYRPPTKFSTWLFAIARNAALDRLRWRRRHPTENLEALTATETPAAPARDGADARAQEREIADAIAAAIAALPTDQRVALVLAEYHDLAQAEIAAVMNCSVKAVEKRIYRARQELRRQLERLYHEL